MKRGKQRMHAKILNAENVGALHTHTHTHTQVLLQKEGRQVIQQEI